MENKQLQDEKARYQKILDEFPAPGGNGCHPYLLKAANYAAIAGVEVDMAFQEIKSNIPLGGRQVEDREIIQAIQKAYREYDPALGFGDVEAECYRPLKKTLVLKENALSNCTEEQIREQSTLSIPDEAREQTNLFLQQIFAPDDLVFIGQSKHSARLDVNLMTVQCWTRNKVIEGPFYAVNPFTGKQEKTMVL